MRISIFIICFAFAVCYGQRSSFPLPESLPEERQFRVVYEWNTIGFAYRSDVERENAIYSSEYIPRNNLISDVKAFANRLYLTIPRMMPGVPATLGWVVSPNNNGRTDPEIEPFPSWEMNEIGNCSALQFVQGIAIDTDGIMWVVDSGRIDTLKQGSRPLTNCSPKLLLLDLKQNGTILRRYDFPEEVAARGTNYLNKIVIDDAFGGFAYITDNSGSDPGIVVFSKRLNRSWKVRENNSMRAARNAQEFIVNGTSLNFAIHIDGIALGPYYNPDIGLTQSSIVSPFGPTRGSFSPIGPTRLPIGPIGPTRGPIGPIGPNGPIGPTRGPLAPINLRQNAYERNVYYSPLSSYHLYSIPASILRNPEFAQKATPRDVLATVTDVGPKISQTDGMIMDNKGILYYGLLKENAIAQWDSYVPFTFENQLIIAKDDNYIQWVDGMSFDEEGYLYVVVNRLFNFVAGRLQPNEINFRILRAKIGALNYVYTNNIGLGARAPEDILNRGLFLNDGFGNGIASTTPYYDSLAGNTYQGRFYSGASSTSIQSFTVILILIIVSFMGERLIRF